MIRPTRVFTVVPTIPPSLKALEELAHNLRWTWDHQTAGLFRRLDPARWEATNHNPVLLLRTTDQVRLNEAARDPGYRRELAGRFAEPPHPRVKVHGFLMAKGLAAAAAMLGFFFAGANLSMVALTAGAALLLTRRVKSEKVLREVNWGLLTLFAGLFVVVAAAQASGLAARAFAALHARESPPQQAVPLVQGRHCHQDQHATHAESDRPGICGAVRRGSACQDHDRGHDREPLLGRTAAGERLGDSLRPAPRQRDVVVIGVPRIGVADDAHAVAAEAGTEPEGQGVQSLHGASAGGSKR